MQRINRGLKHRQAAGRLSNAGTDHHTVVSLGRGHPLYLGSRGFIGLKQAHIRVPSAFGHLLQGQGDADTDFLDGHAQRKHGISEIHSFRLLTCEENTRYLFNPPGCSCVIDTAR
jgi:hypothetical protein